MQRPKTRYAKAGAVHIAYQVLGDGPLDLVLIPGWISHVELYWEWPQIAHALRRLASFGRVVLYDKRGTGLSDRMPSSQLPTLEQRMDDLRAVMDTVGSDCAAFVGMSEGGPTEIMFTATYPERTKALVLLSTYARLLRSEDHPEGTAPDVLENTLRRIEEGWGTGVLISALIPSLRDDPVARENWGRFQRSAASPAAAIDLLRMAAHVDVRPLLTAIRAPTLVIHRKGDRFIGAQQGRHLSRHIAGARYVEVDGDDHIPWFGDNADQIIDEIEQFLTGTRGDARQADRLLATVLFIDIVGSTEKAAALGDRRWRELLDSFYANVRRQIRLYRGREIDTAGDGFLAAFDGPVRAINSACAIRDAISGLDYSVRAGIHTGECEIIGEKLTGMTVHIGARIAALAEPSTILISRTVKDLIAGSDLRVLERGSHELRGVPGRQVLYEVGASMR